MTTVKSDSIEISSNSTVSVTKLSASIVPLLIPFNVQRAGFLWHVKCFRTSADISEIFRAPLSISTSTATP